MCLASDAQFSDFLDGMGPAQFVGRQTLATTSMGESGQRFKLLLICFPRESWNWWCQSLKLCKSPSKVSLTIYCPSILVIVNHSSVLTILWNIILQEHIEGNFDTMLSWTWINWLDWSGRTNKFWPCHNISYANVATFWIDIPGF